MNGTMSRRPKNKGSNGIRVYNTKLFAELCRGVPEDRYAMRSGTCCVMSMCDLLCECMQPNIY